MRQRLVITALGNAELPPELASASETDVAAVLVRAAQHLGFPAVDVEIEHVASVVPGSCMPCIDVVASVKGTALLVARPALY